MKKKQLIAMGLCVMMLGSSLDTAAMAEEGKEPKQETQSDANLQSASAPEPTEAPTEPAPPPTEAPTEPAPPPTEAPTEPAPPPTEAPTEPAPPPTEAPTESPTETAPSETQPPTETTPSETQPSTEVPGQETDGSETVTEAEQGTEILAPEGTESESGLTETATESEALTETETEFETETESETDDLIEEETEESETDSGITNEELIARQNIVTPPDIALEFRFVQVEKVYGVVRNPEGTFIYEETSQDSRKVGAMDYYGLCYILEDDGSGWVYVESANARGYMLLEELATGDTAGRLVSVKGEENLPTARLLLARTENGAYTHTHTTVYEVMASKVYAVAAADLSIRETRQESARAVGTLPEGGLCYILADADKEWVYVESGNARGFVQASQLITGSGASGTVETVGENNLTLAEVLVEPEENKACYYTLTSVRQADQTAMVRSEIVNFAFQFLGNPYVWGGTSLTNGCDCSGFTQSIYANFGYYIPRVAEAQAGYGMQIPVSSAEPGDLIFYAKNGYVYHVSMYIGDGQVIHAQSTKTGIVITGIGSDAVWATRVIQG